MRLKSLAKTVSAAAAGMIISTAAIADGRIQGRVSDSGDTTYLKGAVVSIVELDRKATTDKSGNYDFGSVPAGSYTLKIEYLGAQTGEQKVQVTDDGITNANIQLTGANDRMEEMVVYGQIAGTANALNRQRSSDNLITVVSSDTIGQLPDQNVAEALQRLPGIYLQRDQGEGRFVGIRGLDPNLNNTKINGLNIPAPEGGRRSVALDVIPSDLLEGLEVAKTFTPDMDASGIGGQIDVKSLSAFDRKGLFLKAKVEESYNTLEEETSPKIDITTSNIFSVGDGSDNLGVALAVSWQDREFGSENVENDGGWTDIEKTVVNEFFGAEEMEMRDYQINRERLGVALNFDYKASDDHEFYLRSLYSDFSDQEYRNRNELKFDKGDAVSGDDNGALFRDATMEKSMKDRLETQSILSLQLGGESRIDAWTINYEYGYSKSDEKEPGRLDTTFKQKDIDLGYQNPNDVPDLIIDPKANVAANFEMDEIVFEDNTTEDDEATFKLDFERDLSDYDYNGSVKFGIKLKRREKNRDNRVDVYDGFPGDPDMTAFVGGLDYDVYNNFGPALNSKAIKSFFRSNLAQLDRNDDDSLVDSIGGDYRVEEDVNAFYLMSDYTQGDLKVVYGFRYEQTDFTTQGQRILVDDVSGSGDPTPVGFSHSDDYSHLLPSVNVRYDLNEDIVLRAAYTQTISRPSFGELSPGGEIEFEEDDGDNEFKAELGNPFLKAIEAQNFDASVEYYPGGIGVLSAGIFHKKLKNPIVQADTAATTNLSQFVGNARVDKSELIQPVNGDDADLTGVEISWTWAMDMLPKPFDGFIVNVNGTFIDGEARLTGRSIDLPGMSDTIWNASLGYETNRFSVRLAGTYKSEALLEVLDFTDPKLDRYQDEHYSLDFSAKYRINDEFQVYLNASNLTDEPFYAYFDKPRYNSQYEEYGRTYVLGLRYKL